jgi:hypothetical protein
MKSSMRLKYRTWCAGPRESSPERRSPMEAWGARARCFMVSGPGRGRRRHWCRGSGGRLQRRQGPRGGQRPSVRGRWCSTAGWDQWCSDSGVDEGAVAVASKRSRHGGSGDNDGEGVPARWRRRRRWGPGDRSVRYSHFLGGPAAVVCEGNEILSSDFSPKAGPQFIGSSISSGSTWNRCWYININSGFTYEPLLIVLFRQIKNFMPFIPTFLSFLLNRCCFKVNLFIHLDNIFPCSLKID